jgi:hypothetical protein
MVAVLLLLIVVMQGHPTKVMPVTVTTDSGLPSAMVVNVPAPALNVIVAVFPVVMGLLVL